MGKLLQEVSKKANQLRTEARQVRSLKGKKKLKIFGLKKITLSHHSNSERSPSKRACLAVYNLLKHLRNIQQILFAR